MDVKREFQQRFKRDEHEVRELLRVYLVTDEALCLHHDLLDVVQMAARAGVTCVQLREKHLSTGAFVAKGECAEAGQLHHFARRQRVGDMPQNRFDHAGRLSAREADRAIDGFDKIGARHCC